MNDCCDYMSLGMEKLDDAFHEEEDWNHDKWLKEIGDLSYAVGEEEQMSLSRKTVKILANIRDRQGR